MTVHRLVSPLLAALGALACAQDDADRCRLLILRAPGGVVLHGAAAFEGQGASLRSAQPAGRWQVRFAPGADVRPAPLAFDAPAGGEAVIAIGGEPGREPAVVHEPETFVGAREFGDADVRDRRVRVRARATGATGAIGLFCRQQDAQHGYRLAWDLARAELRLERQLGGAPLLLGSAKAPPADGAWHTLELEVEGFRVAAWCDDEPVHAELDGALTRGRFGAFASEGSTAEFAALQSAPPARPVATLAAVRTAGRLAVTAAAPAHRGCPYWLTLCLDRPTVAVPTSAGFETFLLHQPTLPLFLQGFAFGTVGPRGEIEGELRWPPALRLAGWAALVGGVVGTPNEEATAGFLPWSALRL